MHVPPQFEIAAALNSAARAAQIAAAMKLLLLPALACARTFMDDAGVHHTTDGTPTIITAVPNAMSLEQHGPVRLASDRHVRRTLQIWI